MDNRHAGLQAVTPIPGYATLGVAYPLSPRNYFEELSPNPPALFHPTHRLRSGLRNRPDDQRAQSSAMSPTGILPD